MPVQREENERCQDQEVLADHRHLNPILRVHRGGKAKPHTGGHGLTGHHNGAEDHLQNEPHRHTHHDLGCRNQHALTRQRLNRGRRRNQRGDNPGN